jgi:hypothetical protein
LYSSPTSPWVFYCFMERKSDRKKMKRRENEKKISEYILLGIG